MVTGGWNNGQKVNMRSSGMENQKIQKLNKLSKEGR